MYVLYLEKVPFKDIWLTKKQIEEDDDIYVEDYYRLVSNILMIIAENLNLVPAAKFYSRESTFSKTFKMLKPHIIEEDIFECIAEEFKNRGSSSDAVNLIINLLKN